MDQFLQLPELIRWVCTRAEENTDLLQLALSSRMWLEPALDCLWNAIDSFDPLVACLPRDLWREEESTWEHPDDAPVRTIVRTSPCFYWWSFASDQPFV